MLNNSMRDLQWYDECNCGKSSWALNASNKNCIA